MNLDTVLMCAQATARQQLAAFNHVGEDVQALIDELTTAPAVEPPEVAQAEAQAEETEVVETPANE